jgi:phage shock protein A
MKKNNDIDALFALPLAEFTAARNALAKRLKLDKREDEAEAVMELAKPSVSAWAVNQLYWKHREKFDALVEAGARLGKAQAVQLSGKAGDLQGAMTARRETVSALLQLADKLLSAGGHASTPETMRRIQTTLETLSTSDSQRAGRLTEDIGPVGFESLAAFAPTNAVSARNAIKAAEQKVTDARTAADHAKKNLKDTEDRLDRARTAAEDAIRRVRDLGTEVEKAEKAVRDSEKAVERATTELRKLSKD